MNFIAVHEIVGNFEANGIIGLTPNRNEHSFIHQLFDSHNITNYRIGLNFENHEDQQQMSTITFGYWDVNEISEGLNGLNYYQNIAKDENKWAILLEDIQYDTADIAMSVEGKKAYIDTGNSSI